MVKETEALHNLVIASLLSEGYIYRKFDEPIQELCVPYRKDKTWYLFNYLTEHQLENYVSVKPESHEYKIFLTIEILEIVKKWYINGEKIFNKKIFEEHLSFQSIVTFVNMFGIRQIEGIAIPTNIQMKYLPTLTYCLKSVLNVNVNFNKRHNTIKITDVMNLFLETVYIVSSIDSSELANFLNEKEKSSLIESTVSLSKKKGKSLYANP